MTPGRGIVVLLSPSVRQAMDAARRTDDRLLSSVQVIASPGIYIVDARRKELAVVFEELAKEGLAEEVTLYHGSLAEFFRDLPLSPGLLCADAKTCSGLPSTVLRDNLRAGVPVILRNATGAVHCAQEAIDAGVLTAPEVDQDGLVFHTTALCRGTGFVPSDSARLVLRGSLHGRYFLSQAAGPSDHTPVADLTLAVRREYAAQSRGSSARGPWPYVRPGALPLPLTMPSGKPWPRISIVTPSFNQGAYIEETLLSVLHQDYPNVEHIVIDGGSTDGTAATLDRYRERLTYVVSEPDNGQSHAINKGMAKATGEILTWLNSDDMLAPGALAAVALAFDTHDADMIAGICRLYRDGDLVGQHITACADGPLPLGELLDLDHRWFAGQFFYQPEVMFTRELWLRAGGHVNDNLHYSMDYELWLRFAQAGARLHTIGRPVAWFRLHDRQKTHVAERFKAELRICRADFLARSAASHAPAPPAGELRQSLRITLLNDAGPFFGAGIAHARMARALAWAGHQVTLVSILDYSPVGLESTHYSSQEVVDRVVETNPDLLIVGNLHAANPDPFLLQLLCERFPTALVMHDFWAVTGRCAYPGGCEKYQSGCDHTCPTPNEYPALPPEEIAGAWAKKRLLLGAPTGPALLASSQWAEGMVRRAFAATPNPSYRTPPIARFRLSFPLEVFRPRDKAMCREALGLPDDRFIVFLTGAISDPRKGGMAFLEALARLELPGLLVVTLSRAEPGFAFPLEVRQLGQINGQRKVAMVNAAADVVVAPSAEETFGQTVVEAIACGTPVVGYPASGIAEAIRDGVTGMLAHGTDPDSLAVAVQYLYGHPGHRRDLARWGRLYAENEWSEFAASRQLFLALHAAGLGDRLRLSRRVRFLASEPPMPPLRVVARCQENWRPCQGFSQVNGAVPEHGLKEYRWAYGPSALAELFASSAGLHRVLIAYRNSHEGQHLRLRCNATEYGEFDAPNTGFGLGRMLVVNVELDEGSNMLQLTFSQWDKQREDGLPQAMIVTDILVEPVADCDVLARQTSVAQMLAAVWGSEPRDG